ncbi:Uncharacterised protein [uncultured archaeon]|nr:Uncharacterised protein [uncultured archaeon]
MTFSASSTLPSDTSSFNLASISSGFCSVTIFELFCIVVDGWIVVEFVLIAVVLAGTVDDDIVEFVVLNPLILLNL